MERANRLVEQDGKKIIALRANGVNIECEEGRALVL